MNFLLPLSLWDDIGNMMNAAMEPLYYAVSWVLVQFHSLFSLFLSPTSGWTWVFAIISLTVVIRTALIPLFVRQIRSSRNMQLLGPKIEDLKQKYGHDQERLGQETMKLYKQEGVNPMASCLPLLLQMPIFISLFWVLRDGAEGIPRGVFHGNPAALSSLAQSQFLGAKISGTFMPFTGVWTAQHTVTSVLIVGMTAMLFVTQLQLMRKNMPPDALKGQAAQTQKMMLYMFPVMYLFFGISIPVGVLVYWFTSNLWTMVQQWIMIRSNPAQNTPAYIDWAERMRARGLDPEVEYQRRSGKKVSKPSTAVSSMGVARQGKDADQSATPAAESAGESGKSDGAGRPVVQRQQVTRQPRSARKKRK